MTQPIGSKAKEALVGDGVGKAVENFGGNARGGGYASGAEAERAGGGGIEGSKGSNRSRPPSPSCPSNQASTRQLTNYGLLPTRGDPCSDPQSFPTPALHVCCCCLGRIQ